MHASFWIERWNAGQIGFHEGKPNRFLERFAARLEPAHSVFVPLCGKAIDLDALATAGKRVVGSELVPLAAQQYFTERGVEPRVRSTHFGEVYEAPGAQSEGGSVAIVVGDVFRFELEGPPFDAIYDRAALVALEPSTRDRYADKLASLLRDEGRVLLVTFDHDAPSGPPHAVPHAEIERLFASAFAIEHLASEELAGETARWRERGATYVREEAHLLVRKGR
jgi:thiopurine S-methyltransferase